MLFYISSCHVILLVQYKEADEQISDVMVLHICNTDTQSLFSGADKPQFRVHLYC